MILLQSQSGGGESVILIIQLILRLVGIIVCANKATELNRSAGGWGFFGFIAPIIAMIWIHCLKPNVTWNNETDKNL